MNSWRSPFHSLNGGEQPWRLLPLTLLLLLGTLPSQSEGILCWECNSKTDPGCLDPFNAYSLGSVNCSQADEAVEHLREENGSLREPSLCRKTIQVVEEETRVIRGCGWIPNEGTLEGRTCFSRVGTMGVSVRHCICETDGCNAAPSALHLSPLLLLLALSQGGGPISLF